MEHNINISDYQDLAQELTDLELCANGQTPYFLIIQEDTSGNPSFRLKPDFDITLIFNALKSIMNHFPNHSQEFADQIIELSKQLNTK